MVRWRFGLAALAALTVALEGIPQTPSRPRCRLLPQPGKQHMLSDYALLASVTASDRRASRSASPMCSSVKIL
jgi:hypothetical protein